MELKIEIDNAKLKEFGLDGIFKEAQKQMMKMNGNMFFKQNPFAQDLNAEEALEELKFQKELNKPQRRSYSKLEIMEMQRNALLMLRGEALEIVNKMNPTELSNFVRRNQ